MHKLHNRSTLKSTNLKEKKKKLAWFGETYIDTLSKNYYYPSNV